MKKIVLIFVAVMMMAFSSVCMADDGGDFKRKASAVPGQGDPPRYRRGDHPLCRAG